MVVERNTKESSPMAKDGDTNAIPETSSDIVNLEIQALVLQQQRSSKKQVLFQ
jgi:hypothetical protein